MQSWFGGDMIGIPLGLIYANAGEWLIHKHLLHGMGRKHGSVWGFHWYDHHRQSRRHDFRDPHYARPVLEMNSQGKEALALAAAAAAHLPLLPLAPYFTGTVWASIATYYVIHKKSHEEPEWAKRHLPWHYDHHMGPNQDANWCVTFPLFDHLLGTRERYLGTEREARDRARREAKQHARQPAPVGAPA